MGEFENDLLTNKRGLADSLAGMWQRVAMALKGSPNLLGYELLN